MFLADAISVAAAATVIVFPVCASTALMNARTASHAAGRLRGTGHRFPRHRGSVSSSTSDRFRTGATGRGSRNVAALGVVAVSGELDLGRQLALNRDPLTVALPTDKRGGLAG